jgi:hypothetical protein
MKPSCWAGGSGLLALAPLLATLLSPLTASAQVVISEIHYDPTGGSTNEFVELYNAGHQHPSRSTTGAF